MKIEHQKEFIKGLLSYKNSIQEESKKHMANNIEKDTAEAFAQHFSKGQVGPKLNISAEDVFALAENGNIEPIELIENMFTIVSELKNIEHQGRDIDLSPSKKIFDQLKENFIKSKEEEDIKNF